MTVSLPQASSVLFFQKPPFFCSRQMPAGIHLLYLQICQMDWLLTESFPRNSGYCIIAVANVLPSTFPSLNWSGVIPLEFDNRSLYVRVCGGSNFSTLLRLIEPYRCSQVALEMKIVIQLVTNHQLQKFKAYLVDLRKVEVALELNLAWSATSFLE